MGDWIQARSDGEKVIVAVEGEEGRCEVKMTLAEAERFEEALVNARKKAGLRVEARRSREAMKVSGVEDDEDFEEAE